LIRQVDPFTARLFLSVVEKQQGGRAAQRENVAASTASERIHHLEEIAAIALFERTAARREPQRGLSARPVWCQGDEANRSGVPVGCRRKQSVTVPARRSMNVRKSDRRQWSGSDADRPAVRR